MSGSVAIASGDESALQSAVANVGPISVAVDASSSGFRVRQDSHSTQSHTHNTHKHGQSHMSI